MMFSLKNSILVVAINATAGGAKLTNQDKVLGWKIILKEKNVDEKQIEGAVNKCLKDVTRDSAQLILLSAGEKIVEIAKPLLRTCIQN